MTFYCVFLNWTVKWGYNKEWNNKHMLDLRFIEFIEKADGTEKYNTA